jgi:hypothetical protein
MKFMEESKYLEPKIGTLFLGKIAGKGPSPEQARSRYLWRERPSLQEKRPGKSELAERLDKSVSEHCSFRVPGQLGLRPLERKPLREKLISIKTGGRAPQLLTRDHLLTEESEETCFHSRMRVTRGPFHH